MLFRSVLGADAPVDSWDLIESKPEDLRNFIEEAAGICKYKECRRETENRIRRTHENLARLTNLGRYSLSV